MSLPNGPRLLVGLLILVGLTLMFYVIAYWFGQWLAPRSAARPPLSVPIPSDAAQSITSRHLLGLAPKVSPSAAGLPDAGSLRVLGVASSGPSALGFAIVSVDGKSPVPAIEGQEFAPGLRLSSVSRDGITYERGGVLLRSALQQNKPTSAVNAPAADSRGRAHSYPGRPGALMAGPSSNAGPHK